MKKNLAWSLAAVLIAYPVYGQQPLSVHQQMRQSAPPPAAPVSAAAPDAKSSECSVTSISVSFTVEGATPAIAKNAFDDKMVKLNGMVLQNHIEHFNTLSQCYKISSFQEDGVVSKYKPQQQAATAATYYLKGTAEYQIDSSDNAFKIAQFFTQEKFEVTVSNKADKNSRCGAAISQPVQRQVSGGSAQNTDANAPHNADTNNQQNNQLKNVLHAKPPADAPDPATNNGGIFNQNGSAPDLPVLDQEPPAAEKYKQ